jgi:hypothetical protein
MQMPPHQVRIKYIDFGFGMGNGFGMDNGFQFFGNRMSNYSNIADKQLFNYSNIAVDILVYILAVQYLYFFI